MLSENALSRRNSIYRLNDFEMQMRPARLPSISHYTYYFSCLYSLTKLKIW